MYRRAMGCMRGLAHGFRHGRVRVNGPDQLLDGAFETQRQRRFGDELGRARPDHVNPEHLVVFLVGNDFDEAFDLAGDARACQHART